jgi:hypothetical protein
MTHKKVLENKEQITVVIKDGYQNGDILKLDNTDIHYSWSNIDKTLFIQASDTINIADTLKHLSLQGKNGEDRFLEITLMTKSGEHINLKELEISANPTIINTNSVEKDIINREILEKKTVDSPLSDSKSKLLEEKYGVDFLDITLEEVIPYTIKQLDDEKNGDIYTILKNSLEKQQEIEIWGYDLKKDKVDLSQIANDLGAIFEYSVNGSDIELQVHSTEIDYSIILKEVNLDKFSDNIEEAITNIVINPNKA